MTDTKDGPKRSDGRGRGRQPALLLAAAAGGGGISSGRRRLPPGALARPPFTASPGSPSRPRAPTHLRGQPGSPAPWRGAPAGSRPHSRRGALPAPCLGPGPGPGPVPGDVGGSPPLQALLVPRVFVSVLPLVLLRVEVAELTVSPLKGPPRLYADLWAISNPPPF